MLDVRGMKCGGCSAAVRRILLADPAVESAAVNLLTESAVVRLPSLAAAARHACSKRAGAWVNLATASVCILQSTSGIDIYIC